jgi:hypothetical protein
VADLKARMAKVAAAKPSTSASGPEPAFRSAPAAYQHRVSLDLATEDYRALKVGSAQNGVTMVEILRALVGLWREDPQLQAEALVRAAGGDT